MKLITKETLAQEFKDKMDKGERVVDRNPVSIVSTAYGASIPKSGSPLTDSDVAMINGLMPLHRIEHIALSGRYESGFDYIFPGRGSVRERLVKHGRAAFATGNTLNDNWSDLFDAIRLDLTMRKLAKPTVRQYIYDILQMPNATKDVRPTELFPYGVVFEQHNGEGESVRQGANLGGQYDTIPMLIYAAGFTWTLLAALFDNTYDMTRLMDGVALAYSAKRDDLALAPIIAGTYTGVKATAASSVGTLRQEHLFNTLMDAVDDIGERTDPVSGRKIEANGLTLLCHTQDARHVQYVMSGLNPAVPDKYQSSFISGITNVVGYDGDSIEMPNETISYTGCTLKTAFLVKPNRYFKIPVKRNLVMEFDAQPDVSTLSQEQRAWYFSEAIYNAIGIASFVQKVTLPTW